jgi:hypothetical protein
MSYAYRLSALKLASDFDLPGLIPWDGRVDVPADIVIRLGQTTDTTTPGWKFWLQTGAGNWSPDYFPPFSQKSLEVAPARPAQTGSALSSWNQYAFALSASVAFWLNNATIIFLIGLVWRFARERSTAMKLKTAFATRDSDIEINVINSVRPLVPPAKQQEVENAIRQAIVEAQRRWETTTLNSIYGPEVAAKLRQRMKDLSISP